MSQDKFDTSIAFENMTKCLQEIDMHITALARVFPNANFTPIVNSIISLDQTHKQIKQYLESKTKPE